MNFEYLILSFLPPYFRGDASLMEPALFKNAWMGVRGNGKYIRVVNRGGVDSDPALINEFGKVLNLTKL